MVLVLGVHDQVRPGLRDRGGPLRQVPLLPVQVQHVPMHIICISI